MTVAMRDIVSGAVCAVLGLFLLVWLIPAGISVPDRVPSLALSPAFWPRVLAAVLLFGGVALALQAMLRRWQGKRQSDDRGRASAPAAWFHWTRPAAALALLAPYYLACLAFGLLLPSIGAFIVYAALAGERRYLLVAVCGVLMPVALTLFFIHVANVLIPLGPLWRLM